MKKIISDLHSPLFAGISPEELDTMLGCIGFHVNRYPKGAVIALEEEHIRYIGIVLDGSVDMVKEDLWGNRTLLLRFRKDELFGETFACGADTRSIVTYTAAKDSRIFFLPFEKVLRSCSNACVFHHRLIENMVEVIAGTHLNLLHKLNIISKKSLREKILTYLSLQAQEQGSRDFSLPLKRLELAEYLCADRSALTRELKNMKAEGLIDYDRNRFRIM